MASSRSQGGGGQSCVVPEGAQDPLMASLSAGRSDSRNIEVTYTADANGQMHPDTGPHGEGLCASFGEKHLDVIIGFVVFVNVVLMGVELDWPWSGFRYVEQAMLIMYILDVALRIKWFGCIRYMSDRTHLIDLIIVVASVFEVWILPAFLSLTEQISPMKEKRGSIMANVVMTLRAFRLFRAFRLIKLVRFARPLYRILRSMLAAFGRVCWVMVLIAIFLYAYALVFTQLLGQDMMEALPNQDSNLTRLKHRFNSVPRTFFELFRAMCGDVTDFGYLISEEATNNCIVPIAYMVFQITTTWLILSIFTAEVVDTTISNSAHQDREETALKALHARKLQRTSLSNEFRSLLDVHLGQNADVVDLTSLAAFLEDPECVTELENVTGLTAYQAITAWEATEEEGVANMDDFIDGLVLAAHRSQEHSILRMEAQLRRMWKNDRLMAENDRLIIEALDISSPNRPRVAIVDTPDTSALGASSCLVGFKNEMSAMRADLDQFGSNLRTILKDLSGLRTSIGASRDSEQDASSEVRKLQHDIGNITVDVHCAKLRSAEVLTEIQECRQEMKQACQAAFVDDLSLQAASLLGEVRVLCDGVAKSFIALTPQEPNGAAQVQIRNQSPNDIGSVRSCLNDVQAEVAALRAEIVSLVQSIRADYVIGSEKNNHQRLDPMHGSSKLSPGREGVPPAIRFLASDQRPTIATPAVIPSRQESRQEQIPRDVRK